MSNWLSKLLPPQVKSSDKDNTKSNVPEGLWQKCINCNEILYYTDLEHNFQVCPKCNYNHPLTARERVDMLLDKNDRVEIGTEVMPVDSLKFKDSIHYVDRIKQNQDKTSESEALIVVSGTLEHIPVVLAAFEFRFIGGSMGTVVGERFARGIKIAVDNDCPFICVSASGGARMQEGVNSLMQMAKTCAALTLLEQKKLPFISVLSNPTMGGVSASFAFLGDIVIAEPQALIGFAGQRVIEQTVRQKLPDRFQTAEFLLEKGAIDFITPRHQLKQTIANCLNLLLQQYD